MSKDPKLACVSFMVSSLSPSPVNIIVAQQRRYRLSLLYIALTSTTGSIFKMKLPKYHDSPWITLRSMLITRFFACIAIITTTAFFSLYHSALTVQLPSQTKQSPVGNFVSSVVNLRIQSFFESIRTFAQSLFELVLLLRTNEDEVDPGPPEQFNFHKAAERCGWPDLHRWEITTDMFLDCLQGE